MGIPRSAAGAVRPHERVPLTRAARRVGRAPRPPGVAHRGRVPHRVPAVPALRMPKRLLTPPNWWTAPPVSSRSNPAFLTREQQRLDVVMVDDLQEATRSVHRLIGEAVPRSQDAALTANPGHHGAGVPRGSQAPAHPGGPRGDTRPPLSSACTCTRATACPVPSMRRGSAWRGPFPLWRSTYRQSTGATGRLEAEPSADPPRWSSGRARRRCRRTAAPRLRPHARSYRTGCGWPGSNSPTAPVALVRGPLPAAPRAARRPYRTWRRSCAAARSCPRSPGSSSWAFPPPRPPAETPSRDEPAVIPLLDALRLLLAAQELPGDHPQVEGPSPSSGADDSPLRKTDETGGRRHAGTRSAAARDGSRRARAPCSPPPRQSPADLADRRHGGAPHPAAAARLRAAHGAAGARATTSSSRPSGRRPAGARRGPFRRRRSGSPTRRGRAGRAGRSRRHRGVRAVGAVEASGAGPRWRRRALAGERRPCGRIGTWTRWSGCSRPPSASWTRFPGPPLGRSWTTWTTRSFPPAPSRPGHPRRTTCSVTTPAGAAGREWAHVVVAGVQQGRGPTPPCAGSCRHGGPRTRWHASRAGYAARCRGPVAPGALRRAAPVRHGRLPRPHESHRHGGGHPGRAAVRVRGSRGTGPR
ncbi:hypothetical protein QJS66_22400 [Kocuria rhizophila]|nr:hypothetical protein QJS66_22400 [Kocuria rhizophila]